MTTTPEPSPVTYAVDASTAVLACTESANWPQTNDDGRVDFGDYAQGVRDALRWVTTGDTTRTFLYVINPAGQPGLPSR
jgi:hypothetical protein